MHTAAYCGSGIPPCLVQRMQQLPIFWQLRKLTPWLCKIPGFLAKPASQTRAQAFPQARQQTVAPRTLQCRRAHGASKRHCLNRLTSCSEIHRCHWPLPSQHDMGRFIRSPIWAQMHKKGVSSSSSRQEIRRALISAKSLNSAGSVWRSSMRKRPEGLLTAPTQR